MRAGIVKVEPQIILDFLQFGDRGSIRNMQLDFDSGTIDILIEHPEMPEVRDGDHYTTIVPMYTTYQIKISDPP